jgi:prepilin-type N-terminal cleavage/methylation domain-containing protein
MFMIKNAFTMLELVIVIVVIGILAVTISPVFQRDPLAEAAHQVASHLRYTKHLAMVDNKFNPNDLQWYKARWQTFFTKAKGADYHWAYTVFSDGAGHTGNPDLSEVAMNPLDSTKLLTGGYSGNLITQYDGDRATNALNIGHEYDVKDIIMTGGCKLPTTRLRIAFDYFGRPIYDNQKLFDGMYTKKGKSMLVQKQCQITLCSVGDCKAATSDEKITIAIEPETGYIHIL